MKRFLALVAAVALTGAVSAQQVKVDPAIAAYQKSSGVSGNVNKCRLRTKNTMTLWGAGCS